MNFLYTSNLELKQLSRGVNSLRDYKMQIRQTIKERSEKVLYSHTEITSKILCTILEKVTVFYTYPCNKVSNSFILQLENDIVEAKKLCTPDKYIDQAPKISAKTNKPVPEWRRHMIARKLAEEDAKRIEEQMRVCFWIFFFFLGVCPALLQSLRLLFRHFLCQISSQMMQLLEQAGLLLSLMLAIFVKKWGQ